MSTRGVVVLAIASAIVTANAYYIHPIIGRVAESFGVSNALVGAVPALNQVALALGVLLLLPLGDRMSNRVLVMLCLSAQVAALVAMAIVDSFSLFVIASTILGFFTITPYLLPAYASKRVDAARLGFVTAVLTTGVVFGVQFSRLGSGIIGEYLGWRAVYVIAAVLMAVAAIVLPLLMGRDTLPSTEPRRERYVDLIASLPKLANHYGSVMLSGLIQGLNFATFLATWLGISLYLTGPVLNLGTDVVGYLAACSAVAILTTPRLGRWADQQGPERARRKMATIQLVFVASLVLGVISWPLLLVAIIGTSIVGPLIDVTGRMTTLNQPPEIRTRLMSLYITLMFLGGGLGSWSGTAAYDAGGWWGTVALTFGLSLCVFFLSWSAKSPEPAVSPATDSGDP